MSELLRNPDLEGVDHIYRFGNRDQAIPAGWFIDQQGVTDNEPLSEIFNQSPSGSMLLVSNRKLDIVYHQPIQLQPGRYLLKADIERHTEGGVATDLQYGLWLRLPSGVTYDYTNSSAIPQSSSTGEQLTVFELKRALTLDIGLKVTTSYGSLLGHLLLNHIGLETVPANYGTPVIVLDATDVPPIPAPNPAPSPTPPPTTVPPVTTVPSNPLPALPLPPFQVLSGVADWQYYDALALFFMALSKAAKQGVTNG